MLFSHAYSRSAFFFFLRSAFIYRRGTHNALPNMKSKTWRITTSNPVASHTHASPYPCLNHNYWYLRFCNTSWNWSSVLSFHLLFYVVHWKSYLVHVSKWATHKETCMQISGHLLYAYLLLGNWSHESHTQWMLQTLILVSTETISLSAYAFSHQYLGSAVKKKKVGHVIYLVGLLLLNNKPILVPYGSVPSVPSVLPRFYSICGVWVC